MAGQVHTSRVRRSSEIEWFIFCDATVRLTWLHFILALIALARMEPWLTGYMLPSVRQIEVGVWMSMLCGNYLHTREHEEPVAIALLL
jgi:hypothetical protein